MSDTNPVDETHRNLRRFLSRALDRSVYEPYSGARPDYPAGHVMPDEKGYSGTQTASVVGITYRQLDYWARTDIVRPSISDAVGSGSRRRYSYGDLLELKAIKKLLDAGVKLEQVRKVVEYLRRDKSVDLASAHIVIDGESVNVFDGDQLIDALQNGQGVLNVLSLGNVRQELEAELTTVDREQPPRAQSTA